MDFDSTGVDHSKGQGQRAVKEVTVVEVRNPANRSENSITSYTDYEVCIKTTSKVFIIPQSSVRRRYSDFVWLKKWLEKQNDAFSRVKTPKLPPKKLVGRTDPDFIQKRMRGLQKFLRKIIEHNVFLSDKALHLFLQSPMNVKQIENYLNGDNKESFAESSDKLVSHFEKENKQSIASALNSISENMPIAQNETPEETENSCGSYGRSSSYNSSIASSLLDSFEAINVDDCLEQEHDTITSQEPDIIEHTIKEVENTEEDEDDLDSLDGLAENKENESFDRLLEDDKEQCGSNSSLAECDRLE